MARAIALHKASSWDSARRGFRLPVPDSDGIVGAEMPSEIRALIERMDAWTAEVDRGFDTFARKRISRRMTLAGRLVSNGLHLRAELDTSLVSSWLADNDTPDEHAELFVARRGHFTDRLGDLAVLGSDVFRAADFALPSEVGRRAWYVNARKLAQVLGGRRLGRVELGLGGLSLGLAVVAWRQRRLVTNAIARQLRTTSLFGRSNRRRVDAANRRARAQRDRPTRLDYSRGEHLRAALRVLAEAGVKGRRARALIDEAAALGDQASGKPWRGLIQLRELVTHADLDPASTEFAAELRRSLNSSIRYTHTPGREWQVRDYSIARELLKADGKICRTTDNVAVTQAGASIVPGVLASNPAMLGLAAHYMKPIQVYLNGMVAQSGAEHRRHKNVFQDFFRKGEVLDRVDFIEQTVDEILDEVAAKAKNNNGQFDFKADLAFNFPIRIICHFMGIPPDDARRVQHWSEASVRALDASAGLSLTQLTEGNRAAGAFLDYLTEHVRLARAGTPVPGIIGAVATNDELNELELVSNLAGITFAGFETTTGLLSLGFQELLQHRNQWHHLRSMLVTGDEVAVSGEVVPDRELRWYLWAHDERKGRLSDPKHIERHALLGAKLSNSKPLQRRLSAIGRQEQALGDAVEELLRWTAPGSVIPLTLEEDFTLDSPIDTSIGGCPVSAGGQISFSKGQTITVDVAGANRSGCPFGPGQFEASHGDFDITRSDNTKHLSFGVTHICMGADLAVENAKRMIEGILRRMGDLELDGQPDEADGNLFVGLETLPVRSPSLAKS